MPGKLKKRSLASHAVDDHDHGTASSDLSTQRDAALAAASELEQNRTAMSERSSSTEDLFNVPVGSFAEDSPSRRSPNDYDSTDFIPPVYNPGQPFPSDDSPNRMTAYDPSPTVGDSRRSPMMNPQVPFTSGLLAPQPGFNPYTSPPAYYPYPPRNSFTAMPNNLYRNVSSSYYRGQHTSFQPSPPVPQIPRQFLGPSTVPMSYPQVRSQPRFNLAAKRQRESSPTAHSPPIRTSPISSPRLRKMGYVDDRNLPPTLRPSLGATVHNPVSVHRVTMGGPQTTQSLRNINRMMRPDQPLAVTGKENPSAGCNCKKSRCVKLYCECFAARRLCHNCNCRDCLNTEEYGAERIKAIEHVQKKTIKGPSQSTCNCRRSACLKKYCEAGVLCSEMCKCTGCENRAGSQKLIDKRRKMKDHKGAQYAMEMAQQVWRKQSGAPIALRLDSKPPFLPPPRAGETIQTVDRVAKRALGIDSELKPGDAYHSFEFFGDRFQQRTLAASPLNVLFPEPVNNDQQPQHGFFGDGLPSPSRQIVLKVMKFLSDDDKRTAMIVCKAWASLLTISSSQ